MRALFTSAFVLVFQLLSLGQSPRDLSLNGEWKFVPDTGGIGENNGYANGLPGSSRNVIVPHTWNIDPGYENYYGKAWYQKDVMIASGLNGKALFIKFGAVNHDAVLYINGQKAGEHLNSGYTPFSFDISKYLKYGASNRFVVSVSNSFSESSLPYKNSFDWTNDGGIIRGVRLQICDRPSIRYVHITPGLNVNDSTGTITINVKLNEENINKTLLSIVCKEKKSGKVILSEKKSIKKEAGIFSSALVCGRITPWHFDNPFIYQLDIEIINKNAVTDSKSENFGFRKIEVKGNKLYLNGEPVRLPGLECMPSSNPEFGAAEPREFLDKVVRMMKDLNVVITRFHWQQDEAMLDLMDEYGILVQEELPWWQLPQKMTPQLITTAKMQLTEMTEEHFNHPSIFAWGLSNEVVGSTREDDLLLKSFVHGLDSTRMINLVCNEIFKNLQNDPSFLGDMPTWNEYIGTWHGKNRDELPSMFERITAIMNNRPLLITEHGLCEPVFTGGDARRIDEMLFHIKEWRSMPYIIGYIYFCLNDYRTQMGEEGKGKYKIRRHGLTDMYLHPKASYSVFKQISSPIEIFKVAKINDNDAVVGISNKNSIPSYCLKNYTLKFKTMSGTIREIRIPVLKPGEKAELELKDINQNYSFEIFRPTGSSVIVY